MGRAPCCDKANVKKGPWSPEEDSKLKDYIHKYGTGGNWIALPQKAGLKRCGKSCRLRWLNYLRPNLKHGDFSEHEDMVICTLFANIGSRWSIIAGQLPGRTDNDIKNYWNTKLKKKLLTLEAPLPHTQTNNNSQIQSSTLFQSHTISPFYCNNPSNLLNSATCFPDIFQIQDHEGLLVFGSDQASCSSSDGSYSNSRDNQIHSIKQEEHYHYHYQNHQMGPPHHGLMNMSNANNGYFGEVPFSYDTNYGFNIFTNCADVDENKTQADGNDDDGGMKKEGMDMSQQCYY